jgi:hypothetical protein
VTVFELLVLVVATPGAVLALRDVCARRALLHDSAPARGKRSRGDGAHGRAAPPRTTELAISVRFQIARARDGLDRMHDAQPHPVEPPTSTERAHADAS